MAAEFNIHHLVELDDATFNSIFRIRLHKQADDGSEQVVEDIDDTSAMGSRYLWRCCVG